MDLNEYINKQFEPGPGKKVDEALLTLMAGSVLAYLCQPLLNSDFAKAIGGGIGGLFAGIGAGISALAKGVGWAGGGGDKDGKGDDQKKKENDVKSALAMSQMADKAQKAIDNSDKDDKEKTEQARLLAQMRASMTDKDGNFNPPEEWAKRYKEVNGTDIKDDMKKANVPEKISEKDKEALDKEVKNTTNNTSAEEAQKQLTQAATMSKGCADNITTIRTASLGELNNTITNISKNDPPASQNNLSKVSVPAGNQDPKGGKQDPKGGKQDPKGGNQDPKGGNQDPKGGKQDPKGGNQDPKGGNQDPKGGKQDPKGGKPQNGERIEDQEVTDKNTGKKIKVKMHVGPRGGKYYWPDGVPHDDEHKVYADESINIGVISLAEFLSLNL